MTWKDYKKKLRQKRHSAALFPPCPSCGEVAGFENYPYAQGFLWCKHCQHIIEPAKLADQFNNMMLQHDTDVATLPSTEHPLGKEGANMDPSCPKCGSPMHWRDSAGLTPLHPEGAWECSNQRCWNMVPPGELAPDTIPAEMDTAAPDWQPEGWDAPEPMGEHGRCPMCKHPKLQYDGLGEVTCPACGWQGESGTMCDGNGTLIGGGIGEGYQQCPGCFKCDPAQHA